MTQTATEPVVEVQVPPVEREKGEREYRTFLHLLPQLLVSHRGQYVAVHNGEVVDSDMDDISLIQRVHARFGYVPIHVGLVTDRPPLLRIPHYHEHQPADGP
jgi:hypothetical protein